MMRKGRSALRDVFVGARPPTCAAVTLMTYAALGAGSGQEGGSSGAGAETTAAPPTVVSSSTESLQ